jgi:hypothetical protein
VEGERALALRAELFLLVSAVDSEGQTIWIVDAHRDNGTRFVARAEEKLTALIQLESAIVNQSPAQAA